MAALTRFIGEGAVEHAARSRSRTRWQHQLAVEEGTWPGLLCDLAETGATTVIDTHLGRRLQGVIVAVGSDFVTVTTSVGGHLILRSKRPAIPNAIAALLLYIRDQTGVIPHVYFGWTEGNPIAYLLKFLAFGEGDTAPVTREVLRQFEADPSRRPRVHVG